MAETKDRESSKWYKLDNAAKIIPSSAKGADTRVFRICCELKEEVDPDFLQDALDDIREEFPLFNCVLKKGFFWYYLEDSDLEPEVTEDHLPACSPIYYPGRVNLLYRVSYYSRRINLEMFHVLADGTGGFVFLKRLVSRYLELSHDIESDRYEGETSSVQEKGGDAFDHYYTKRKLGDQLKQVGKISVGRAYQITGDIDKNLMPHLIEGAVSASRIVSLAKENETTVGVYTTSLYIQAVIDAMSLSEKQRPVVVQVPVNLRQFFSSDTTRNFFGVISVVYYPKQYDGSIASIIKVVKEEYEQQLSEDKIEETMNTYASWEHNIAVKMVPIWIKDIIISFFNGRAKNGVTTTLSNLGRIQMPESLSPYVDRFSAFMAAPSQQVCISSFGDRMVFGEVSPYSTHEVMLHFFRRLVKLGVDVELSSNDYDEVNFGGKHSKSISSKKRREDPEKRGSGGRSRNTKERKK